MLSLRNEAIELASNIPEKYLPSIIRLMKSFAEISEEVEPPKKKNLDLSQYVNKGEKLFKNTEEIDNYIRESRSERF